MTGIDEILYDALSADRNPDAGIDQAIIIRFKEEHMNKRNHLNKRRYRYAAVIAIAVLLIGSVTVYAALRYLSAGEVAIQNEDERLAWEFTNNNKLNENVTQSYCGYDITLLGVVSGKDISDNFSEDDQKSIDGDKTYIAVAISHSDGSPMPDQQSDEFDPTQFFVSPYIRGLNPVEYNAYTLDGGFSCFVADGIQYRLLETDTIEEYADNGLYIGISEGMAYNGRAYSYDAESGIISRNEGFEGVNALFELILEPAARK